MNSFADNSDNVPYVAIWMVTYNHEKYISKAIESILNQKVNFKIALFIGEDCSKDNTREICEGYSQKFPNIVRLISTERNNILQNVDNIWKATITSGAKYIATCEGDDYWTDPYKLQKQVDFLDANPDFSMCFSKVHVIDQNGAPMPNVFPESPKEIIELEDIVSAQNIPIPFATLFFRNILPYPMPSFYFETTIGDSAICLLLTDKGKGKFMDEKMAAYRQHAGGFTKTEFFKNNEYEICYKLYEDANAYFNYRYDDIFKKRLSEISRIILIYGSRHKSGFKKIKHVRKSFSKYMKYAGSVNVKEIFYYLSVLFFPFILKIKARKNIS